MSNQLTLHQGGIANILCYKINRQDKEGPLFFTYGSQLKYLGRIINNLQSLLESDDPLKAAMGVNLS